MQTASIRIQSRTDSKIVDALLLICEACEGNAFHIYVTGPELSLVHLQCQRCGDTYCQGHTCQQEEPRGD